MVRIGIFLAATEIVSRRESNVQYIAPVFAAITDIATGKPLLHLSQETMKLVGQQFTIVTFDLAAAKNALNIVWQRQQEFKNVVIMLGIFHLCRAYMYMCTLGKSVRFSGFVDILLESGICASESIEQVLSGKNYNRALRVQKCITKALKRLLLHAFEEAEHHLFDEDTREMFQQLSKAPSADMLAKLYY